MVILRITLRRRRASFTRAPTPAPPVESSALPPRRLGEVLWDAHAQRRALRVGQAHHAERRSPSSGVGRALIIGGCPKYNDLSQSALFFVVDGGVNMFEI